MAFCGKCGTQIDDNAQVCPSCGAPVAQAQNNTQEQSQNQNQGQQFETKVNEFGQKIAGLNNTQDSTAGMDPGDIASNKAMAILSYFGLLVLIPIFAAKDSKYARFHAGQGLNLLILEVAYSIIAFLLNLIKLPHHYFIYTVYTTPWFISLIVWLLSIPILVLAILGIVNAATGKAKELPVIGKFKILK